MCKFLVHIWSEKKKKYQKSTPLKYTGNIARTHKKNAPVLSFDAFFESHALRITHHKHGKIAEKITGVFFFGTMLKTQFPGEILEHHYFKQMVNRLLTSFKNSWP